MFFVKNTTEQKKKCHIMHTDSFLNKFGITALNPMQEEADIAIKTKSDVVLLSPTGTGKTLAFLLP